MVKYTDFRLNQANFGIKWANFDLLPTKLQTSQASLNDINVDLDGTLFLMYTMFLHVLQIKIRLFKVFLKVLKNKFEFFRSKNFFRKEFCEKHWGIWSKVPLRVPKALSPFLVCNTCLIFIATTSENQKKKLVRCINT